MPLDEFTFAAIALLPVPGAAHPALSRGLHAERFTDAALQDFARAVEFVIAGRERCQLNRRHRARLAIGLGSGLPTGGEAHEDGNAIAEPAALSAPFVNAQRAMWS